MTTSKSEQPAPDQSFFQWLLSENNIKIALYSGGFLLVLAGLIFLGTNWTRLPQAIRFSLVAGTTVSLYVGGFLLWKRPLLRLGSIVLVSIASFFVPITFAALHLYLLQDVGIGRNIIWLYASLLCLPLYIATALVMRRQLFTFLAVATFFSGITAVFVLLHLPLRVALLAYALLPIPLLLAAKLAGKSTYAGFTRWPLLLSAHLTAPLFFLFGLPLLKTASPLCVNCSASGHPLFALAALFAGAAFYATDDTLFEHRLSHWLAPMMLAITAVFAVLEFNLPPAQGQFTLMGIALAYQGIGYQIARRARKRHAGRPIYSAAYVLAILATLWAATTSIALLGWMLLFATAMLTWSAFLLQKEFFAIGAIFVLPIAFTLLNEGHRGSYGTLGLLLTLLILFYCTLTWLLAKTQPSLNGWLLTAVYLLTPIAVVTTLLTPALYYIIVLLAIVLLYLWLGWWQERPLVTAIALLISNLALVKLLFQTVLPRLTLTNSITYAATIFAIVGLVWFGVGLWLRQREQPEWAFPWLLFAAVNGMLAYTAVLPLSQPLSLAFSILFAAVALFYSWHLSQTGAEATTPWPTYIGLLLLFVGHFYLMALVSQSNSGLWMPFTAVFCTLYILIGGAISQNEPWKTLYGQPMHWLGIGLTAVPLLGLVSQTSLFPWGITLGIIALLIISESFLRTQPELGYAGSGLLLLAVWLLLIHWQIDHMQAYTLPSGLWLLAIAAYEQHQNHTKHVFGLTFAGLSLLLLPAIFQSFLGAAYALWLLGLTLFIFAVGLLLRSRLYIRLSFLALLANGFIQFSPIFASWERFLQIGLIGTILLASGIVALFWREHLITSSRKWQAAWQGWNR